MTERQEQMIYDEGYRKGKADRPKGTYTDSNECEEWYGIVTKCNECGAEWQSEYCNFCPNCGADMRGEDDE